MVVGGPNARTDYHVNSTPEFFYQHKGSMLLKIVDETGDKAKFIDVPIHEGSLFLLPGNTPHNPVRFANTVGVVLEVSRPKGALDRLRWYCDSGNEECEGYVVHEMAFECTDLGTQVKAGVQSFAGDESARTCGKCGKVVDVKPSGIVQPPRFPE